MRRAIQLSCVLWLVAAYGLAQPGAPPQRGIQPNSVYSASDVDSVDVRSGNLRLQIPLAALPPGPGGSGAQIGLTYNSQIYDLQPQPVGSALANQLVNSQTGGGWRYSFQYSLIEEQRLPGANGQPDCSNTDNEHQFKQHLVLPDGSRHLLRMDVPVPVGAISTSARPSPDDYNLYNTAGVSACPVPSILASRPVLYTDDGTFIRVVTQPLGWTAYFPDGRMVEGADVSTSRITDRNGNAIAVTGYFDVNGTASTEIVIADQVNRRVRVVHPLYTNETTSDVVTREYCSLSTPCGPADAWQANQTWTVNWKVYTAVGYHLPWICGENWSTSTACDFIPRGNFVSGITLPSALTYEFHYNLELGGPQGWGELWTLKTPGGYTATYNYDGGRSGPGPVTWNPVTQKVGRYLDGHSETWTYAGSSTSEERAITAPDGGIGKTTYTGLGQNMPWKTEEPNGDLVKRLWLSNAAPNPSTSGALPNAYVKTEYRFIKSSGALKAAGIRDYTYDKNGNLVSMDEYDCLPASCGSVSTDPAVMPTTLPGGLPLARHTEYTYVASTPAATSPPVSNEADAYWDWTAPRLLIAKKNSKVTGSGYPRYSEFTYDEERGRGNLTQEFDYDSTKAPSLSPPLTQASNAIRPFGASYDSYGNLLQRLDANNTATTYVYGTGSCMNSYPTAVTSEALTTTMSWDCRNGQLLTSIDPNQLTTTRAYDLLDRVLSVTEANGGNQRTTTISYSDVNRTVTTVAPMDARTLTTTDSYDERGRPILTKVPNASCTQATVERRYLTPQGSGFSYELVSNPYCSTSETTMGWTRSKRDPNGRVTEVATYPGAAAPAPWGSNATQTGVSTTDYTLGDQVDSTDPAGKKRRTRVDGLARLVQVIEDPNTAAFSTTYGYDLRDGLTLVTQTRKASGAADVAQNRTFTYDSLGRLGSATNVESGMTSYTYDDTGNVHTTTPAGGTTRTYGYNTRNQITSKIYSATIPVTPQVYYCYDGKVALTNGTGCAAAATVPFAAGRLAGVGSTAAVTNYTAYDWLGRNLNSEQWVDGIKYPFTYNYLAGSYPMKCTRAGRR